MNGATSPRHSAKRKTPYRRRSTRKNAKRPGVGATAGKLFVFTIDADTARIVKFESLDANGSRRELSVHEKENLIRASHEDGLEGVLERAFEAGIACVLGDEAEEDRSTETDADTELRHLLLARLMEHSTARAFTREEGLNRAILEALIQRTIRPQPVTSAQGTGARQAQRSAPARTN